MDYNISECFTDDDIAIIKKEAPKAEELGRWTNSMIDLCNRKRLFHLLVPKAFGGFQLPLPEVLPWLQSASYLDGSFGWTLTLGAGAGIFGAFMDPDLATDFFSDDEAFIAGSGFPGGKAEPTKHGYQINGYWKYISGWDHANLITASCFITKNGRISSAKNEPEIKAFAFYPDETMKAADWKSYGLKATGSHSIEINDVYIPEERSFTIHPEAANVDGILYQYPFEPFAQATLGISLIGIAQRFRDETRQILLSKENTTDPDSLNQRFSEASAQLDEAGNKLYQCVQESWEELKNKGKIKSEMTDTVSKTCRKSSAIALEACQKIYPLLGMSVIHPDTAINRAWRDLHTASQHMLLSPIESH